MNNPETNSSLNRFHPIESSKRLHSLDILRGVAILAIFVINIEIFAQPVDKLMNPTIGKNFSGLNYYIWLIKEILFFGKFWTIFAMLFGAGAYLLITRAEKKGNAAGIADIYYRRLFWLIFFGLIHAYFIWDGDVLYFYAMTGLFLYPLRKLSVQGMLIAFAIIFIIYTIKPFREYRHDVALHKQIMEINQIEATGQKLTDEQQSALDEWKMKEDLNVPSQETLQKEIEIMTKGTYYEIIKFNKVGTQERHMIWFYDKGFLRTLLKMILGMALMKSGILIAQSKNKTYLFMAAAGYIFGLSLVILRIQYLLEHNFSILSRDLSRTVWEIDELAVALGHIGIICLFCKLNILNWLKKSLAAVGRMAFTNYIMQSLIGTFIFYSYGFGLFGTMDRTEQLWIVGALWLVQLIVSPIWLKFFQFGPVEWLWRSLTYWQRQPIIVKSRSVA